jgi:hypothetical protein
MVLPVTSLLLLEIDRNNKNEEDQTNYKDFNVKTPPIRRKKSWTSVSHNFHYFVEYLQERRDMFGWLIRAITQASPEWTKGQLASLQPTQASRRRAFPSLINLVTFKEFGS